MSANDIWRLTAKGLVAETTHIHTLHFKETIGSAGTGASLLATWGAAPRTAYRGQFSNEHYCLQEITVQKVCGSVPLPAPTVEAVIGAAGLGTRVPSGLLWQPAYLAACVTEKGTYAGRRYSGRYFIGGFYAGDVLYNTISTAHLARLNAYADALRTAFVTGTPTDWRLFAFSELLAKGDPNHTRQGSGGGPRIADPVEAVGSCELAGSDVANLIVNVRPTTMRSRKLGHGP